MVFPDGPIKSVANSVNHAKSYDEFCTRICARMMTFLLTSREDDSYRQKSRFPLVNRLFFETKRNVWKSTISES